MRDIKDIMDVKNAIETRALREQKIKEMVASMT